MEKIQNQFQRATKKNSRLRLGLIGPAGSGKTYTALNIATYLNGKIALLDTERGSASKYAGDPFEFDVLELTDFHPQNFIDAIHSAETCGYETIIIDSLSHAWVGKSGELELVNNAASRSQSGNSFAAWREVTPLHHQLVDAMLSCAAHLIVTMRSKTEWVIEENEKGKKIPRKIGLAPIQRDGMEYEFDVVGDLDQQNTYVISKSRCSKLHGQVIARPGREIAETLLAWLGSGVPVVQGEAAPPITIFELRSLMQEKSKTLGVDKIRETIRRLTGKETLSEVAPVDYGTLRSAILEITNENNS